MLEYSDILKIGAGVALGTAFSSTILSYLFGRLNARASRNQAKSIDQLRAYVERFQTTSESPNVSSDA